MQLSGRWHVQLGEGGRRMTDSQVKAAAARCWIDAETPVRKPQSSEWTKLGDVAPSTRITEERVDPKRIPEDIDTSAMTLLSGEFEVVDDSSSPTKEELAAARPRSLAPKLFVAALAMLAGGGVLAHRSVPWFDAELQSVVAAMGPAPIPTPAPMPTTATNAIVAPAPVAMTVTSSATLAIVPKMRAPSPKMREPSAPPAIAEPVKKATKKATSATARPKRPTGRH